MRSAQAARIVSTTAAQVDGALSAAARPGTDWGWEDRPLLPSTPGIERERALLSAARAWRGLLRLIKPSQAHGPECARGRGTASVAPRFQDRGPQCTVSDGAFDMLSPAERALLTEKQDRLIELFVLHDEATLLHRSPAWAASGRVRPGRDPSTMQGHPS